MPTQTKAPLLRCWIVILLGVVVYAFGLGGHHQATGPDELLYVQMTRLTAASGHLLPLQSMTDSDRNTKPPLLFWQGIFATDRGREWTLARVRLPGVLYTLLTAALLVQIGARRLGSLQQGLLAAALFLCFFSTFRYGRVLMTVAPETFWLFLPLAILLMQADPVLRRGPLQPCLLGAMVGVALLYWSFALVIPVGVTIALWSLRERGWKDFLFMDAWRIALLMVVALLIFGLWFVLDPRPSEVFTDFVLRENAGKFSTGGGNALISYLQNALCGRWNIWKVVFSLPYNAGLLAPAVVALAVDAWRRRRHLDSFEVLLWIWLLVLMLFFCIPNRRHDHYPLPAMPALALLLALRLEHLPRWALLISLAVAAVLTAAFAGLGMLLQQGVADSLLYPWWVPLVPLAGLTVCAAGFLLTSLTRPLLCPAILLAYLCSSTFLIPLDHGPGLFGSDAVQAVAGKEVFVTGEFGKNAETYVFLLPGARVKFFLKTAGPPSGSVFAVMSQPLDQAPPPGVVLGRRLNLTGRLRPDEIPDVLQGNISRHLFSWDWLVQRQP